MEKVTLEELYPHLFMNDPKSIVNSMLKVDQEAAKIRAKARGEDFKDLTIEEKRAIAFQCIENNKKQQKERQKLEIVRNNQKKILREYDPRVAIEERHTKINEKRQERIKNSAEERLEQLRVERQRLVEEISPVEMEKIKLEIKKTAEEVKKQDMIQKKQIRELQEMEKIARNQEILRQEMEKKQKELQEFRAQKFIKTLKSFKHSKERHFLFFSFNKLNTFSITLKTKSLKIMRKSRFKKIFQSFHTWKKATIKAKLEEEAVIFQAEQERMHYLLQLGQKNYEFCLKRKALESFAKFLFVVRREKREAKEIQARREKFENFMNFVRIRTEEENTRKLAEEENMKKLAEEAKKIKKTKEKPLKHLQDRPFSDKSLVNQRLDFEEQCFCKLNPNNQHLSSSPVLDLQVSSPDNEKSSKSSEKTSSKQDASTFIDLPNNDINSESSKVPVKDQSNEKSSETKPGLTPETLKKTPKPSKELLGMQQRQEERKLKRDALDAKYKEKKEKEEQAKRESEQKALEEEKKKKKEAIDKRKQAEKTKKELEEKKKKELEDLKIKTEIAEDHHQVSLLKVHLHKWQEYHYNWQRSLIKSEVFHDRAIQKNVLQMFKQAVQVSKTESLHLEVIREERAFNHFLFMLKKRKFLKWLEFLTIKREEYSQAFKIREKYLKNKVFVKWNELIPELLDERYEREKEENFKVERFRLVVVGPKVLKGWKEFVEGQKEDQLKQQFASAMWEKAQEWLSQVQE